MQADLAGQIHELMERGMRPVTMTDITSRAPVRMTVLERAMVRSRRAGTRFAPAPGGPAPGAPAPGELAPGELAPGELAPGGSGVSGSGRGDPRRPRRA